MNGLVCLVLLEEGLRKPLQMKLRADDRIGVLELSSRAVLTVRAADVSVYRHTVLMGARSFRVLNVLH